MAESLERWECPNCGTPLNIAALGIYAKVACPACGHIDRVHTMLANFRLEGVLGLGGMSVVLRAKDLVLERPLAIKLLNEFYRDQPERMARFEQECELMAKVRHENVVSLYSAGRVRGQFYIAMELVNGRNLEELVREQGPMDPLRVLDVLGQVVRGLEAAHKAGLLHRDMKPGNIIICEDGRAKVLDFGLSLGKRDADTEEIIWATPYYVPPETLMRAPEDLRTDIYALGMTLRHLLTGKNRFETAPSGIEEMLDCKRSLPSMAEQLPDLPEAYCDLIDHMTAYEPDDRPGDYASLIEEIAEVRDTLSVEGKGAPFRVRLRRSLPLLAGVVATLVLGGGAAALSYSLATPDPELLYVAPVSSLPWQERDTLAAAMSCLQSGNLPGAAAELGWLADSEGEPAACAWAALHAEMFALLRGREQEAAHFRERVAHHLSRTPASAGQGVCSQIASLREPGAEPREPFLLAVQSLLSAEKAVASCREREWSMWLQNVRGGLRACGDAYAPVLGLLSTYEQSLMASRPERLQQYYRQALSRLDIEEAQRVFAQMGGARTASAGVRREVQREALPLFVEAVEMMKRRSLMPPAGETVSPDRLKGLLEPLGEPVLADELATLMLVALGEMGEAASRNPHASSPESAEPFAIMMRDWMLRVSRY